MPKTPEQMYLEVQKVIAKLPYKGYAKLSEGLFPLQVSFEGTMDYLDLPIQGTENTLEGFLRSPDEEPSHFCYKEADDLKYLAPALFTYTSLVEQARRVGLGRHIHPCAHSIGISIHNPEKPKQTLRLRFVTPHEPPVRDKKPIWVITPDAFFIEDKNILARFEAPTRPQDIADNALEMLKQLAELNHNPITFDPFEL
jgi:hypothetical protein